MMVLITYFVALPSRGDLCFGSNEEISLLTPDKFRNITLTPPLPALLIYLRVYRTQAQKQDQL